MPIGRYQVGNCCCQPATPIGCDVVPTHLSSSWDDISGTFTDDPFVPGRWHISGANALRLVKPAQWNKKSGSLFIEYFNWPGQLHADRTIGDSFRMYFKYLDASNNTYIEWEMGDWNGTIRVVQNGANLFSHWFDMPSYRMDNNPGTPNYFSAKVWYSETSIIALFFGPYTVSPPFIQNGMLIELSQGVIDTGGGLVGYGTGNYNVNADLIVNDMIVGDLVNEPPNENVPCLLHPCQYDKIESPVWEHPNIGDHRALPLVNWPVNAGDGWISSDGGFLSFQNSDKCIGCINPGFIITDYQFPLATQYNRGECYWNFGSGVAFAVYDFHAACFFNATNNNNCHAIDLELDNGTGELVVKAKKNGVQIGIEKRYNWKFWDWPAPTEFHLYLSYEEQSGLVKFRIDGIDSLSGSTPVLGFTTTLNANAFFIGYEQFDGPYDPDDYLNAPPFAFLEVYPPYFRQMRINKHYKDRVDSYGWFSCNTNFTDGESVEMMN